MKINADTRLAPILKHHPDALEAIVSIHPHYKKLRNPVLRKIMAGRTTIGQAAKFGGCSPEDFFLKLEPLGFVIDRTETAMQRPAARPLPPFMLELEEQNVVTFDVRPILSSGKDPLSEILGKLKEIGSGKVLKLVNSFEPTPLMEFLKKKGYESYAAEKDEQTVETWFHRASPEKEEEELPLQTNRADWNKLLDRYKGHLVETDVRPLAMPLPMMTILDSLDKLPDGHALYVHHKRVPVFLLPELKDRHFDYRIHELDSENVDMLIFKS